MARTGRIRFPPASREYAMASCNFAAGPPAGGSAEANAASTTSRLASRYAFTSAISGVVPFRPAVLGERLHDALAVLLLERHVHAPLRVLQPGGAGRDQPDAALEELQGIVELQFALLQLL